MTRADLNKARMLLKASAFLTDWEIAFLKTCAKHYNTLTPRQTSRFQQIIAKHHKTAPPEREQSPLKRTDTIKMRFTRDEILKSKALRYFPLKKRQT